MTTTLPAARSARTRASSMLLDPRLGVGDVGRDRHLPAGVADRRHALGLQREREQADRDLLAGRRRSCRARAAPRRVVVSGDELLRERRAGGWSRRSSPRERRPSGARPGPTWRRAGDALDALRRAHRGAAVLVNDQCHGKRRVVDAAEGAWRARRRKEDSDSSQRPGASRLASPFSAAARSSATCGSPAAASARASMPSPGTKTIRRRMRQTIGPSRAPAATPAPGTAASGCAAVAPRRPGSGRRGDARAARGCAAVAAEMPPRSTRSTRNAPRQAAISCRPGRLRSIAIGSASIASRAPAAHAAGGRDSCAARRRRPASGACPRRAPRRSRRSTRVAGGGAPSARAQPAQQRLALARVEQLRARRPGRGRARRAIVARSSAAISSTSAAACCAALAPRSASATSASANAATSAGQTRRRRRLRAKRSSSLLSSSIQRRRCRRA